MELHKDVESFSLSTGAFIEYYNEKVFTVNRVYDTPLLRDEILQIHIERHMIFARARMLNSTDYEQLATCRDDLQIVEYYLQKLWGFPSSPDHHAYWYTLPHCLCPNMDNADNFGTSRRIFHSGCPYHGENAVRGASFFDNEDTARRKYAIEQRT